jgi:hypothetical protein
MGSVAEKGLNANYPPFRQRAISLDFALRVPGGEVAEIVAFLLTHAEQRQNRDRQKEQESGDAVPTTDQEQDHQSLFPICVVCGENSGLTLTR